MTPHQSSLTRCLFFTVISFFFFSCKKEYSCEGCINGNKPPIANTGPDQVITLPTDSASLDGSSSTDPDGKIVEQLWTKISGPASFTITNSTVKKTAVRNLSAGIYQFELKVTDDGGLSAKDSVLIVVNDPAQPNRLPIANAGADQTIILPTNEVTLDGSGSTDPDNDITNCLWTKISGPSSFSISNSVAMQTQITNLIEGVYRVELKVIDAGGLFSKDTVAINVNAPVVDTTGCSLQTDWEITLTLPIDSAFIDDYFRDTEGICVGYVCGPAVYSINGGWVKNLVPGVYYFRRYWANCVTAGELVKVIVLNDPNEPNTVTYKKMLWEYNFGLDLNGPPHLYLTRPHWPGTINPAIEVYLQMDSLNNGEWFQIPENLTGNSFWFDCQYSNNNCLSFFIVRISPEYSNWDGRRANLKMKIL